ncbi:MAG: transposase [Deltaproteobacteria bacterium]|nr:transposase [Deltaproteobacteria bacterium]MBW2401879.1 transposase [Deltaproteobacteria bacterium]
MNLVDHVLPDVPIRQWVLTLPYQLRYRCAYDARLTSAVLRAFIRALFAELRRRARRRWDLRAEQCGAVTFIQRFGSALNLNLHFHTLVLDGVYTYTAGHGQAPRFLLLPPPNADEVARVLAGTARRIQRLLEARAEDDSDALARDEPLLALLAAASLRNRIATGPHRGEPWRRIGDRVEPREVEQADEDPDASARVPQHGGMSLHAEVAVPARDRRRLERLCRYVARPALAHERLEERSDGRLALRLKTRWRDGTTHILMERSELIERLVPLIPPPRAHQVRYHGILAPSASQRDWIVPDTWSEEPADDSTRLGRDFIVCIARESGEAVGVAGQPHIPSGAEVRREKPSTSTEREVSLSSEKPTCDAKSRDRSHRMRWASLLQRVFEIEALRCPRCGSTLRLIAAIEDPTVARKILACLKLPARAPPLEPAEAATATLGQAEGGWLFDQSLIHDEP